GAQTQPARAPETPSHSLGQPSAKSDGRAPELPSNNLWQPGAKSDGQASTNNLGLRGAKSKALEHTAEMPVPQIPSAGDGGRATPAWSIHVAHAEVNLEPVLIIQSVGADAQGCFLVPVGMDRVTFGRVDADIPLDSSSGASARHCCLSIEHQG